MQRLFSSNALYRILALFFRYPVEQLNPRLISRHAGVDIKAVVRELKKLEEMGILRAREAGRYRMYTLNHRHPVLHGLASIFNPSMDEDPACHTDTIDRMLEELTGRV